MNLLFVLLMVSADVRPTVALVPPIPEPGAEPWIGYALADNLDSRLLFHSRFDPKTVTRVYSLSVFGWRQVLSAARAEGIDAGKPLTQNQVQALQRQLGADHMLIATYSQNQNTVSLHWNLFGDPSRTHQTSSLDLNDLTLGTDALAGEIFAALGQATQDVGTGRPGTLPLAAIKPYAEAINILKDQSLDPRAHLVLSPAKAETARTLLKKATSAQPDFARAWVMRAIASSMLNDMTAAEQELVQAMATAGEFDPTTSLGLSYVYDRQNNPAQGIDILKEATTMHAGFLQALGYLGQAYIRMGNYAAALHVFDLYCSRAPRSPWARVKRAECLAKLGKQDEAIAETKKVLNDLPDSVMVLAALASRQIDANQFNDAEETVTNALNIYPGHPVLLTRLSYVALAKNDIPRALLLAQQAVEQLGDGRGEPLAGYAFLNLGYALALSGKADEAMAAWIKAKQLGVEADQISTIKQDSRLAEFFKNPKNPF